MEVMKTLKEPYDFIFMDAAKGTVYLLPSGSDAFVKAGRVVVSDNVLQEGDIIESRFAVERRNRTIHSRMREYLYALKHDERLLTSLYRIGDGATVSELKIASDQRKTV